MKRKRMKKRKRGKKGSNQGGGRGPRHTSKNRCYEWALKRTAQASAKLFRSVP